MLIVRRYVQLSLVVQINVGEKVTSGKAEISQSERPLAVINRDSPKHKPTCYSQILILLYLRRSNPIQPLILVLKVKRKNAHQLKQCSKQLVTHVGSPKSSPPLEVERQKSITARFISLFEIKKYRLTQGLSDKKFTMGYREDLEAQELVERSSAALIYTHTNNEFRSVETTM